MKTYKVNCTVIVLLHWQWRGRSGRFDMFGYQSTAVAVGV